MISENKRMKKRCRLKDSLSIILLCCFVMMIPARIYAAPSAVSAEGAVSHTPEILPQQKQPSAPAVQPRVTISHTPEILPQQKQPSAPAAQPRVTNSHTPASPVEYTAPRLPDIRFPKLPDHIKIPEIHIDPKAEKDRLREAVRTMDEMGISPKMLFNRFRNLVFRRKSGDEAEKPAENSGHSGKGGYDRIINELSGKTEEQIDKTADQVRKEIGKAAEEQIDKTVEQVKKEIGKAAEEQIDQAVDQVVDNVKQTITQESKEKE